MLNKKLFILLSSILLILNLSYADTVSTVSSLAKDTIYLDETVILKITVSGLANCPFPEFPMADNFIILNKDKETQVVFKNEESQIINVFNFLLSPLRQGNFLIGKTTIKLGDNIYTSDNLPLTVLNRKQPIIPKSENITIDLAPKALSEKFFITLELDKQTAYIQEQLTLTLRFFHKRNLLKNIAFQAPTFKNCIFFDLGKERYYEEEKNGFIYDVTEKKTALFPLSTGINIIEPAALSGNITYKQNDNYHLIPLKITSKAIEFNTQPLPHTTLNLQQAIVGDFNLKLTLSKKQLQLNDSLIATIIISGFGEITTLPEILSTTNLKHFSVYTLSTTKEQANYKGKIFTKITIKQKLLPKYVGNLIFPELTFSFFNNQTDQYQSKSTPPYLIKVAEN